jgi:hypothetical protein
MAALYPHPAFLDADLLGDFVIKQPRLDHKIEHQ